jgi:hypothetical protein
VPVVVVLVFVSCAEMTYAPAMMASAIAPKREKVLTVVSSERVLMNTA